MNITTKMIAEQMGVSRITVDRALNGRPGVSERTRQRILNFAKEAGYRPNRLAQSLVNGVSKSLGIVVFDLDNAFFAQLVDSFQRIAFDMGYMTYVMLTNKNASMERRCVECLLDRRVDGILLYSVIQDEDYISYLKGLDLPVLTIMNRLSDALPLISVNNRRAMADMTGYVISKGYSRLVYVCPPLRRAKTSNMTSLIERREGFYDAVRRARVAPETVMLEDNEYIRIIGDMSFDHQRRTAIICTSDIYAVSIMNALQKRGYRTPMDYGLCGFDCIPMLREFEPNITTVSMFIREMGSKSAALLVDAINGVKIPEYTEMTYEIVTGQTVL